MLALEALGWGAKRTSADLGCSRGPPSCMGPDTSRQHAVVDQISRNLVCFACRHLANLRAWTRQASDRLQFASPDSSTTRPNWSRCEGSR